MNHKIRFFIMVLLSSASLAGCSLSAGAHISCVPPTVDSGQTCQVTIDPLMDR